MKTNIFKNREIRLAAGMLAVLCMVWGAVVLHNAGSLSQTVNRAQIKQNISVIGALAKKYPQAEAEIVREFTSGFQGNYDFGKSILDKYSYDESLNVNKNPMLNKLSREIHIKFQIIILLFSFVLLGVFIGSMNGIFRKIRNISISAEAVVEGNYEPMEGDREEGDIGRLIYQFNSMTERLSENVQALVREKLFLKRLVTDISHQLKTPLASLIMFNDILRNDSTLSGLERNTFLLESKNQLDRMEWLIKNLLKMAKLESGTVEFELRSADVALTLKRSAEGLRLMAEDKNIRIVLPDTENVFVKHDVSWTTEALSNIIKNCIEHSKRDGEINITLEENSIFAEIEIRDNGEGIPKEQLPRIFDRFYKGAGSSNPTNIGIGLYITKTVIEGQGGSVYAYSRENGGTVFVVRCMKII